MNLKASIFNVKSVKFDYSQWNAVFEVVWFSVQGLCVWMQLEQMSETFFLVVQTVTEEYDVFQPFCGPARKSMSTSLKYSMSCSAPAMSQAL